jgi:hypothetical protein
MQLREYLSILRRLWPLIVALPLLAGGLSLALGLGRPQSYQASARIMVSLQPIDAAGAADLPDYNNNYSWLTSEYMLDDLPQVVNSVAFAEDVRAVAAEQGYGLQPEAIRGGLRAEVLHRSVVLVAVADSAESALATVRGAVEALERNGLKYWDRAPAAGGGMYVAVLDPPGGVGPVGGSRDLLVDVAMRAALALAAALGLTLLIHYLDDRLRGPRQAEQWTGLSVLAVIPKEK